MLPRRFHRLRAVLDRRQPDLTVLLDQVHKPHNLSAVLRSCDAVGVFEVHAVAPERPVVRPARAISRGTGKWVQVVRHGSVEAACDRLEAGGFRIWAAHPGGEPEKEVRDYREVDYTVPTAIVLGQEKDGVSRPALARAHGFVAVPMEGMVTSLNVSVAAALLLYEARRQRQQAGFYAGGPRLPEEVYRRTLFEWVYPQHAALCLDRGVPYPDLGEDGELLGDVPRG